MLLTVCGKKKEYPDGTVIEKIAEDHQDLYPDRIMLGVVNGQLKELFQPAEDGDVLEFETMAGKSGNMTYQRSLLFLLLKASCDILGRKAFSELSVEFSVNKGLFIRRKGHEADPALVKEIEDRMRELVREDLPFHKETVKTREARERFRVLGMDDKVELLSYRIASFTNVYRLAEYEDYYYAYMVPSTRYLATFRLFPYKGGMILQTPLRRSSGRIVPYRYEEKIFDTLLRAIDWSDKLKLRTVGNLNSWICRGETAELILLQEAYMEHEIGEIAEEIEKSGKRLVMIAGPSSSGKTTFSHRLALQLRAKGLRTHAIACDDYFKDRDTYPVEPDGSVNFESIECVDVDRLNSDLKSLLKGKETVLPTYDFVSGKSIPEARKTDDRKRGRADPRRDPLPERPPDLLLYEERKIQDLYFRADADRRRSPQPDLDDGRQAPQAYRAGPADPRLQREGHDREMGQRALRRRGQYLPVPGICRRDLQFRADL